MGSLACCVLGPAHDQEWLRKTCQALRCSRCKTHTGLVLLCFQACRAEGFPGMTFVTGLPHLPSLREDHLKPMLSGPLQQRAAPDSSSMTSAALWWLDEHLQLRVTGHPGSLAGRVWKSVEGSWKPVFLPVTTPHGTAL